MAAERTLTIENESGLHARPAARLVQAAKQFQADIVVNKDGQTANCKSVLAIMKLGISKGATVSFRADGADADAAVDGVVSLLEALYAEDRSRPA
jgi:phosphocarrier protein HPr